VRERTGIVLGTNSAGILPVAEFLGTIHAGGGAAAPPILFPYTVANAPASQCALHLDLRGPNLTIVQKEGSSCGAIATACRILASGGADAFVAGGADDLGPQLYEAYDRVGVLSRDARGSGGVEEGCRPFDLRRNGVVLGEGACFLLLEPESAARARGARPLAIVEGVALGRAPVAPHGIPRDPAPLARTIRRAIESAGATPGDLGAVFASASGSPLLDAVEAAALRIAFEGAPPPAVSVRGAIGESGAGGAASAAATSFALESGRLPGTAGLALPDPALGLDVTAGVRELPRARVLVTGFSSGGSAAALVLAAA
jgi:3-oxoacyl-[acyl-carrier-protein] synthase II